MVQKNIAGTFPAAKHINSFRSTIELRVICSQFCNIAGGKQSRNLTPGRSGKEERGCRHHQMALVDTACKNYTDWMLICSHSPTNQSCCLKSCQEKHQFPPCCNFPSEELLREALHFKQLGLGRHFREHALPRCSAERPVLGNLLSFVPARTPNMSRVSGKPWVLSLGSVCLNLLCPLAEELNING